MSNCMCLLMLQSSVQSLRNKFLENPCQNRHSADFSIPSISIKSTKIEMNVHAYIPACHLQKIQFFCRWHFHWIAKNALSLNDKVNNIRSNALITSDTFKTIWQLAFSNIRTVNVRPIKCCTHCCC